MPSWPTNLLRRTKALLTDDLSDLGRSVASPHTSGLARRSSTTASDGGAKRFNVRKAMRVLEDYLCIDIHGLNRAIICNRRETKPSTRC